MVTVVIAPVNQRLRTGQALPSDEWPVSSCEDRMVNLGAANLIGGFIFGSIGFIAFVYGKRMTLWKPMFCGIALMVFPYFVENTAVMFAIGSAGTIALFFVRN